MDVSILFADDDIVVVNKPAGQAVHRGWARDKVVTMTAVRDALGQWVYPVHRLDRPTSGALVLALHQEAAAALGKSFAEGGVDKRYVALTRGVTPQRGRIDHPIPRSEGGPRVRAVTRYTRLGIFERYSWVRATPLTGRLHQIRRHFKHISHPLIGDVNYGKGEHNRLFRSRFGFHRLALHATSLAFAHPNHRDRLQVSAPLTEDLRELIDQLGLLDDGDGPPLHRP